MLEPVYIPGLDVNPLVSILITNYNYANYLDEAVSSTLCQTYSNLEIIICDDGSTDHSDELLCSYQETEDSRITIIKKENGGMASAYNTAFQNCKGEIICFLDADDLFYPEKISGVIQVFRENPEAGFLIHRLDKTDHQKQKLGQLPLTPNLPYGWLANHVVSTGSCPHGFPVTSGLVLRRKIARRIFPLNNDIVYDLDEIIRRLAVLQTNVIHIEDSLGAYRIHGKNMTAKNVIERLKSTLPVYETMWQETKTFLETISPEDAKRFPALQQDIHYLLTKYVLAREDQKKKMSKRYWQMIRESSGFKAWSPARKVFWYTAVHLPELFFKRFVSGYWHSAGNKLQLSRIQQFIKKVKIW